MSKASHEAEIQLASELAAQLRMTLGKMRRKLREHGAGEDLKPSQVAVLLRLEKDGPATVSSLARAEGMRPQSMSAIITALQEADLVSGIADPDDGRKTLMALSKRCETMLRESRAARQDWLTTAILQKLSEKEQKKLSKALALLGRLADDVAVS